LDEKYYRTIPSILRHIVSLVLQRADVER
jgi:hypothetical protein